MEYKELNEFIHFFTHNKTLTRKQQLKRDALLARDMVQFTTSQQNGELETGDKNAYSIIDSEITSIIGKDGIASSMIPQLPIEETPKSKKNPNTSKNTHRDGIGAEYFNPKNLQNFLKKYNSDEVLKYTAHPIDDENIISDICEKCSVEQYDYVKHLDLIKSRFKEFRIDFTKDNRLPPQMVTLINVYLTGEYLNEKANIKNEGWSSDKITINWNSKELKKWATDNPTLVPNPGDKLRKEPFPLPKPFRSSINGRRVSTFTELVSHFKNQFHIRFDYSLHFIVNQINMKTDSWHGNANITFTERFIKGIELFTDVDKLMQAYKSIIDICIKCRPDEAVPAEIELSFYDDRDTNATYFCIHHLNSTYKKSSKNAMERIGESHCNLIEKLINGLCDLYIEAHFNDGKCGRINLWNHEDKLNFQQMEDVKGVKYILMF